jgi:hypothetical protein
VATTSDLCAGNALATDRQRRFTVVAEHGPMPSAATYGGKGPTHGWGTAGERGRGVAAGGVDWRSDRVRKKAWGKQEEEEGWFGGEAKEEA